MKEKVKQLSTKMILGILLIIVLFAGYAAGRAYKTYEIKMAGNIGDMKNMDHAAMGHAVGEMKHDDKELVDPTVYAPKILKLETFKDSMSGYNIKVSTANFEFAPENVGQDVKQNEGHIHVYVNGVKVGRGYSAWYHIPASYFKPENNTISVTLNANNHNVWWSKKGTLEARANIEVNFTK